jgi:DNA-binding MarR family transcriptional regulator
MNELDQIVGQNLRILSQVLCEICQRSTLREASEDTISRNQFTVLKILDTTGSLPFGEFARILGISSAAVSKIIDRLEQLDLVERQAFPGDRRSQTAVLLPAAHQVLARHEEIASKKQEKLMDHFSDPEKEHLLDYMRRIIKYTIAEEQDTDMVCFQCGGKCGDECVINECEGACTLQKYPSANARSPRE